MLGEAVLGEEEADKRFNELLNLMELDEVDYISVKISAIVSQIIPSDLKGSCERVAQKLRVIYRKSLKNNCFINLCLLYTSPSPRDAHESRMPSSA